MTDHHEKPYLGFRWVIVSVSLPWYIILEVNIFKESGQIRMADALRASQFTPIAGSRFPKFSVFYYGRYKANRCISLYSYLFLIGKAVLEFVTQDFSEKIN